MIFFIIAAIALFLSVYALRLPWSKSWARWTYAGNMLLICTMLVIFGLEYKIGLMQAIASRRTVAVALDVSASTGLTMKGFAETADKIWSSYSLEIIPFSDDTGAEGAESTAMVKSLKNILSYLSGRYDDNDIAAFVVISDGNETERIAELKDKPLLAGKFPHNVVYTGHGGNSPKFDKSVSFIRVPRFMPRYSKEVISFSVSVAGAKLEGVPVDLKLNGKNIGTTFVHLKDGYGQGEFELLIKNAGISLLEASIAKDSRETITDNNRDYALIEGIHKGFRVLHLSGHPSPDTAFIRRGLQNIPGVDMISFYILRKNKQVFKAGESELSLIPFPTDQLFRDELDNFDLIIINDFRLTDFLNPYYINNIVKFVESGGGLLIMGGPESFDAGDDVPSNRFESILPFYPINNSYENRRYVIREKNISKLTPMAGISAIKDLKFTGLNRVRLKDWANVFYSTDGLPVITGGIRGKARVLAVLTDSFWRFSYNAGLSNETALKSLVRYVLGISTMPVNIYNNTLSFDGRFKSMSDDVYARIRFLNYDGTLQKEEIVKASAGYELQDSDSRLLNIAIEEIPRGGLAQGRVIDRYQLLNYHEKRWHEHAYLPMGKEYLQNFAKNGNGDFVVVGRNEIGSYLKDLAVKDPVVISEKKEVKDSIYKHKAVLIFFLYLIIASFYLKSRYAG